MCDLTLELYALTPLTAEQSGFVERSRPINFFAGVGVGGGLIVDGQACFISESLFVSIALAASSVRSMCGSERSPPACNKQSLPASTPHVGQGTASNSCGVRSIILTVQAYGDPSRKTVQIGTEIFIYM